MGRRVVQGLASQNVRLKGDDEGVGQQVGLLVTGETSFLTGSECTIWHDSLWETGHHPTGTKPAWLLVGVCVDALG